MVVINYLHNLFRSLSSVAPAQLSDIFRRQSYKFSNTTEEIKKPKVLQACRRFSGPTLARKYFNQNPFRRAWEKIGKCSWEFQFRLPSQHCRGEYKCYADLVLRCHSLPWRSKLQLPMLPSAKTKVKWELHNVWQRTELQNRSTDTVTKRTKNPLPTSWTASRSACPSATKTAIRGIVRTRKNSCNNLSEPKA